MPGAVLLLGLFLTAVLVACVAAWIYTRDPAHRDPREDYRQLQRHAAWLEQRLDAARRERWTPEMIASLSNQLGDACQELARARGGIIDPQRPRPRHGSRRA